MGRREQTSIRPETRKSRPKGGSLPHLCGTPGSLYRPVLRCITLVTCIPRRVLPQSTAQNGGPVPTNRILNLLALRSCSHQFSWPRRSSTGDYYQVCVLCGDEYGYDWDSMQRLGRKPPQSASKGVTSAKAAVRWSPRARRMRLAGPVRYRELGADAWSDGEMKNISKSGLLFAVSCPLSEGARIEIELDMPSEICGSIGRRVRCDARVVRTGAGERADLCAAQIFDYTFIDRVQLVEVPSALNERKLRDRPRRSRRHARSAGSL